VALLFAVLGGLFLMHGLSSHGAMHHEGSADVAMVHAAETPTVHSDAVVADVSAGLPTIEAPAHRGGHAAQFAELCMAVLAGGLLLALLTRRGGTTAVARARRTHRTAGALAFAGRPPDPPDLRKLSVCRC
jgi:hypothetical protein